MKPTTEILARISQNSLANKEEVFTKLYRYLLRPDIYCRGRRKVFLPSIQNSLKVLCFLDFRAFSLVQLSPCSLAFRGINSHIFSLKSSTKSSKLRGKSAFYYSLFATLFNSSFASSYPKWV